MMIGKIMKKQNERTIVITSGYFDPIHRGHLRLLNGAKALGNELVVIVNSDAQAIEKKGYVFMPVRERVELLLALRCVNKAIMSLDQDGTVCKTIEAIKKQYDKDFQGIPHKFIFAKGGDSTSQNVPEVKTCKKLGIYIILGVGGEKVQSSSQMVKNVIEQINLLNKKK